jgi:hypothetical protein
MSAEVVNKRGRPKKVVVPEFSEVEVPPLATKTKSTKAIPKAVSTKPVTPPKTTVTKKTTPKTASVSKTSSSNSGLPIKVKTETPLQPEKNAPIEASQLKAKSGIAKNIGEAAEVQMPKPSPILAELQKLKEKSNVSPESSRPAINPAVSNVPEPNMSGTPSTSAPNTPVKQAGIESSTVKSSGAPTKRTAPGLSAAPTASAKPPPSKPAGKPHVPLAQLNSDIVSNITTRAGARPNTEGSKQLPQNYKAVSRKVTMAIVALPIAIVTSYVLYQRCKSFFWRL